METEDENAFAKVPEVTPEGALRSNGLIRIAWVTPVSLAEILDEIPRLTSAERQRLAEKLVEIDGDWLDGDESLSAREKNLLESRLADHERNPDSALPWEEVKARLQSRFVE